MTSNLKNSTDENIDSTKIQKIQSLTVDDYQIIQYI